MNPGAPLAAGLGGVLLFLAAGLGLVELLPALRARPFAARLGWAYLLGVASVPGIVYVLGVAFDVRVRRGVVLAPALVLALAGLVARARRGARLANAPVPPPVGRRAARVAGVITAVLAAGLFAEAATTREMGWDAEMTWSVAARWVRADRSVTPRALTDAGSYVNHPQYPLLLPLAQVAVLETFDAPDDARAIKPLYAAFYAALLLVLFDVARRHAGTAAASLATLALALAPYLLTEKSGGASGAYSDVPLGALWGAGLVLLAGRTTASGGAAAGVLLAAAVLAKNEGLPFAAAALAAGILGVLLDQRERRSRLRSVAVAAVFVLAAAAVLHAWKARIPQRWDEDYAHRLGKVSLAAEAASRLPLLPRAVASETSAWKHWDGLWIAAGIALVAGAKGLRRRIVPPLALAVGASFALYVAALLLSTWGGVEQVPSTWNRLLLQMSVPLGLLLALALREGLRSRGPAFAILAGRPGVEPLLTLRGARRAFPRESLVFLAFLVLTCAATWPWIAHLKDHCSDRGDPYFTSWVLWWDFHQTFHDPLHLFDGNIFFPCKYSLAFSEHDWGLALPMFPLFALGLRPLTAHGVLTLLGFAFSGYGAFRLGRTLTGSLPAAWVAGVFFAFVPYRFGQLPHLVYLSAGWIPILLEALVLFARARTPRRAAWLGVAFFLNGVSVIHWLVLTLIPLALTAVVLAFRERAERDVRGWARGAAAVLAAGIALLPFLLPYRNAALAYGFKRSADEALEFSATPADWLNADPRSHVWRDFGAFPTPPERPLFPGLLLLALPLAAVLLSRPVRPEAQEPAGPAPPPRGPGPARSRGCPPGR